MEDYEKIEMVEAWAENHPNFDLDFIYSIKDALEEYGELTYPQSEALDNIIKRFRIHPVKD